MSNDAMEKINLLTNGTYAKDFFTKNGLEEEDIRVINQTLTNKLNNNTLNINNIEKELQIAITEYRYQKKIINKKESLSKNTSEKEIIFKINNDIKGFVCRKCNQPVLSEFNFCPKCGNKVEIKDYKLIPINNIDLSKGYVTSDELEFMRFVSPEEIELINEGTVNPLELGIAVTENNCPFEIKYDIIHDKNFQENKEYRKIKFNEGKKYYNKPYNKFKLTTFNQRRTLSDKKFPLNFRINNKNEIIEHELLKREFLPKIKEEKPEQPTIILQTTPVEINLEYAGVMYLFDVIKHPKSPKLYDSTLSSLKVSSNKKVINYLRKNNLLINAEGLNLIIINLKEKKVKYLKNILSKNNLQFSGTKDEIIKYLIENLPKEELVKYEKGKALLVTPEGLLFLDAHPHVEAYINYLKNYSINDYEKYYQENKNLSIKDVVITFLEKIRGDYAQQLQWRKVANTYTSENRIYKAIKDIQMELETTINQFICALNPWADNAVSLRYSSVINQTLQNEIIKIKKEFDENTIYDVFMNKVNEIKLPGLFLEDDVMLDIFMRISEDNLESINNELESKFNTNELKPKDTKFISEQEQEEVFKKVRSYFK